MIMLLACNLLVPGSGGWQCGDCSGVRGARGEKIDVTGRRNRRHDLGGYCNRVCGVRKPGEENPDERDQRHDRVSRSHGRGETAASMGAIEDIGTHHDRLLYTRRGDRRQR